VEFGHPKLELPLAESRLEMVGMEEGLYQYQWLAVRCG
jgi:hypothetical protein